MNNNKFKTKLFNILKEYGRLWNEDETELNQILLLDLADNMDKKLIELLLNHPETKEKFFMEVSGSYVFKTKEFKFFIEENKVNNSYTRFANKIGLSDGDQLIKDKNEVVLNFPYKDCVLQGGQKDNEGKVTYFEYDEDVTKTQKKKKNFEEETYNEKTTDREEIFFNQILAQDEIDRLRDDKAFINWKRYYKNSVEDVNDIKRDSQNNIKENIVIEGNNYLALNSLKSQFTGKVKAVIIDPPYYFEKSNKNHDSFVYNSNFKLSTWLVFIKNRLEIAKKLMRDDGLIFVSIDDGGQPYLKVLMDEIYGKDNFIANLPTIMNLKGNNDEFGFAGTHEYTVVYAKNKDKAKIYQFPVDEKTIYEEWEEDEIGYYKKGANLKATGTNAPREKRPNLFYPIYVNPETKEISLKKESEDYIEVYPITNGEEMSWRWSKKKIKNEKYNVIVNTSGEQISFYKKQRPKLDDLPTKKPKTIFYKPEYSSGNGTKQIKEFFGEKIFNNPKPVELIKDFVLLSTKEDDIILDFFAGSGTTAHAALSLNEDDGGNRQFILIEQMDYVESVTVPRVQKVMQKEDIDNSFLYFELAKWNRKAKNKINNCDSLEELKILFDELYNKYFLNYNLKIKEFKEEVINEEDFKQLSLKEQKKMFLSMLDLNQMYVQKSEMEDKKYGIGKKDQKLTKMFYLEG
jgi:adenine-specific DNA-methyltransferase